MADWVALLAWRRDAIVSGELWRLVTGHLVHYSSWHTLLNVIGAALVFALYGRRFARYEWLALLIVAIATIDVGLQYGTDVEWYVGASGVLHAAMAAGITDDVLRRERFAWAIAVVGVAKLVYEQWAGSIPWLGVLAPAPDLGREMPVIFAAHLWGVSAGVMWALARILLQRVRASRPASRR